MTASLGRTRLYRSVKILERFRNECLLGVAPAKIAVDGHIFHDELEAEGYLVELRAAIRELDEKREA